MVKLRLIMDDHYDHSLIAYIFCQPQQILSLRLGEQIETIEIGDDDHYVQYDVTTDDVIIT